MFDYITAREIRLLSKLRSSGYHKRLSSQQRIRFELLGLIKDGPGGIQLTPKGVRVARVRDASDEQSEHLPGTEAERIRALKKLLG